MNREEFMSRLETLLTGISEEEKQEALTYYRNYFDDAGVENEQQIIRELESPEKVAESIRRDFGITDLVVVEQPKKSGNGAAEGYAGKTKAPSREEKKQGGSKDTTIIVLLVILLVLTAPVWIGFAGSVLGVIVGVFFALVAIALGGLIGGVCILGLAVGALIGGSTALGLIGLGIGLLMFSMGALAGVLLVLLCGMFLPWLVRELSGLGRKKSAKKGAKA